MEGVKHDEGKAPWHRMPWRSLREVLRVMEHGAAKYGWDNWRHVEPITRYEDAALRHLIAHVQGELVDDGSGLHPLAHVIANCLIIMEKEQEQEEKRMAEYDRDG